MYSLKEGVLYAHLNTMARLKETITRVESNEDLMACVFILEDDFKESFTDNKDINNITNSLRTLKVVTVLVLDTSLDESILDWVIASDICILTERGSLEEYQEEYDRNEISMEQILYLLGTSTGGSLINQRMNSDGLMEELSNYMGDLLFGKNIVQIHLIKEYFNLYKTENWKNVSYLKSEESKKFIELSQMLQMGGELDGV